MSKDPNQHERPPPDTRPASLEESVGASEMARQLGVKTSTVYRWARLGLIPELKITRKVRRYLPREVLAALAARAEQGRKPQG
jgi:excisionase family DNA binding protein